MILSIQYSPGLIPHFTARRLKDVTEFSEASVYDHVIQKHLSHDCDHDCHAHCHDCAYKPPPPHCDHVDEYEDVHGYESVHDHADEREHCHGDDVREYAGVYADEYDRVCVHNPLSYLPPASEYLQFIQKNKKSQVIIPIYYRHLC